MIDVEVRSSGVGPRWRATPKPMRAPEWLLVHSVVTGSRLLVQKDWPRDGVAVHIRVRP